MGFPLAVAPSVRSPGLALLINLLAGIASTGSQPYRGLVIASKTSAGSITPDTQLVQGLAGADDGATFLGGGAPGHLALKRIFEESPLAQVDLVAPLAPAGATAAGTFTFTIGTPPITAARTIIAKICGRAIQIAWFPGESVTTGAARLSTAINAQSKDLPVTSSPAVGVVNLISKLPGTAGNDITISVITTSDGAPPDAIVTASGTTLTGGTLAPDLTNVLALVSGKEYDLILDAASGNTDATTASSSTTVSQLNTFIGGHNLGFNAHLQQGVYAVTSTLSAAKTGTAFQNIGWMECAFGNNFQSLPAELGGAEMGARLREELLDPAVNRIHMEYRSTLYPPDDLVTFSLTAVQVEDALQNGVMAVDYNASNQPRPTRPITSYFKDTAGNPDDRLLDISRVTGTYAIGKDIRITLPIEFKGAKLSPDLAPSDDPPPAGTVEVRDIKSFVISRLFEFVARGVATRQSVQDSITNGTLIVQVDPIDPSQCDIVIPEKIVPPLAKFSVVLNHVGT